MSEFSTVETPWRPLRDVDRRALRDARLQAHAAVQWLARVARAYIAERPDDAHTNLGWDDPADSFVTHALRDGSRFGLNVVELILCRESGGDREDLPLQGCGDKDIRKWLGNVVEKAGLKAGALDAPSPYEASDLGGVSYDPVGHADGLAQHAAWYADARSLLEPIRKSIAAKKIEVSEVRCWPHHFDLATLISFPLAAGETGYVGAGLSPGDSYYDEPYFYVSAYPSPESQDLPKLPSAWHWHTVDFTAAIFAASSLSLLKDQQHEIRDGLNLAVQEAIGILGSR